MHRPDCLVQHVLASLVALISSVGTFREALADEATIGLGSRRELLVDRFLIERLDGARLHLHSPQRAGVVLSCDRPWEGCYCGYFTVFQDGSKYRMYYRGLPVLEDASEHETTCYAESADGITWTKPDLGLFEVHGTRKNNVVLHGLPPFSHNFAPFLDRRPGVSESERYKALAGTERTGLVAFVSSDALSWRRLREKPVIASGAFDSQNVAFWSELEQRYTCYYRIWPNGVRWIARTTSTDFLNWSEPVPMGYGGAPPQHLYTNQTTPYFRAPHLYISLPMRFVTDRSPLNLESLERLQVDGRYRRTAKSECSDGLFMTSRSGAEYDRLFLEAFVRPGPDSGNWVSRSMMAACGMAQTGPTELSLYYEQHDGQPTKHLARYTLRLDGFVSVRAPFDGGELVTKPITFAGDELEINFATSAAGGVRVEIQNPAGSPLPGFALADCAEFVGDSVDHVVAWKSGSNVGNLAAQPIKLRFVLRDADLYSFRFRSRRP